jgi:GNAT superfamily N-acetyltransferase
MRTANPDRRSALSLVARLCRRIPLRPVKVGRVVVFRLDAVPREQLRARGPGSVRLATYEDLNGLAHCRNRPHLFAKRFSEGDRCVVGTIGGRIVGFEWFSLHATRVEERYGYTISVPSDAVYLYDAYIEPRYRLSGFWVRFKAFIATLMEDQGRTRFLTLIDEENTLSMRTHTRFGYRPVTDVRIVSLLGRTYVWERPA